MSRIVHVIGSLDRGGAESVLLDLVRGDTSSGHIVICWSGREGRLADSFRESGAEVLVVPGTNEFARLRWFYSKVRSLRPTTVVSHLSLASAFILATVPRSVMRRIARVHSAGDGRGTGPLRTAYRAVARLMLPAVSTHVLAVSNEALQFAIGGAARAYRPFGATASHLPNGVDTERFKPREQSLPNGEVKRIIYVGRAAPEKNRVLLVPIFSAVQARRHIQMQIVGTTETHDLGPLPFNADLEVLGSRDDIEVLIAQADVLVLCSTREGLPGVVLEALASAVPVVASDLATLRDLQGELDGIQYVDVTAPPATWADAIEDALSLSWDARLCLRERLLASRFTMGDSLHSWAQLWR